MQTGHEVNRKNPAVLSVFCLSPLWIKNPKKQKKNKKKKRKKEQDDTFGKIWQERQMRSPLSNADYRHLPVNVSTTFVRSFVVCFALSFMSGKVVAVQGNFCFPLLCALSSTFRIYGMFIYTLCSAVLLGTSFVFCFNFFLTYQTCFLFQMFIFLILCLFSLCARKFCFFFSFFNSRHWQHIR